MIVTVMILVMILVMMLVLGHLYLVRAGIPNTLLNDIGTGTCNLLCT